jgi:hypothetical protein
MLSSGSQSTEIVFPVNVLTNTCIPPLILNNLEDVDDFVNGRLR